MGKKELQDRSNWQETGGSMASNAEEKICKAFECHFNGTTYIISKHPTNFKDIYTNVELPEDVLDKIYNPNIDFASKKWGLTPDFAIENTQTNKILFGEIKRQDGWIEGKEPNAGRGNAHERMCKLFTPGLLKVYREKGNIESQDILPFWVIFCGDITRDPKRNREIAFWFDKYDKNYFMLRPGMDNKNLTDHFDKYLKPYLE